MWGKGNQWVRGCGIQGLLRFEGVLGGRKGLRGGVGLEDFVGI